ncbi:MAG: ATP-binding protein [Mycobacteriales bacterium]
MVDAELAELLAAVGAVVLEGPRAVGKTATARRQAASEVLLDIDLNAQQLAAVDPALLLPGAVPRLVDEWQIEPRIWNQVRREVDARGGPGQFILTGSAVPADDETRHTGAGRIARLRVRPMSLFESGHSSGEMSLAALFDGTAPRLARPLVSTLPQIIDRICVGGFPTAVSRTPDIAQRLMRAYLAEVARADIQRVDGVRRDPVRVERVLRSLGRNVATEAKFAGIALDVGDEGQPVDRETVTAYLDALERLMIVENVSPWSVDLRSRSRLRQAPKRHFADPSLAVAAVDANPRQLLADLRYTGLLFESLVVRDLRIYMQRLGGRVLHYRDSNQHEVDAILQADDGRWAAVEVKLGLAAVDAAADSLDAFMRGLDLSKCGDPSFTAVITADGTSAYRRPDGLIVLPIGALGP